MTDRLLHRAGRVHRHPHASPCSSSAAYKVRLFDSMSIAATATRSTELVDSDGDVELIENDVRYGGAVHAAMQGLRVRHPLRRRVDQQERSPTRDESIDINMVGNHNVFAAAADPGVSGSSTPRSASRVRRPGAPPDARGRAARPADPVLHHQARRRAPARLLRAAARVCRWIALRFFNVYGPGQKPTAYYTSVINHFVNRLARR